MTGSLRPRPTDNLPIFAGTQPAELRRKRAKLPLAHRAMAPGYLLQSACGTLGGSPMECGSLHNTTKLLAFTSDTGIHRLGMALPKTAWVRLNRLGTGGGRCRS